MGLLYLVYIHIHFFILFIVKECVPGCSSEKSHVMAVFFSFPRKSMGQPLHYIRTCIVKISGPNSVSKRLEFPVFQQSLPVCVESVTVVVRKKKPYFTEHFVVPTLIEGIKLELFRDLYGINIGRNESSRGERG